MSFDAAFLCDPISNKYFGKMEIKAEKKNGLNADKINGYRPNCK